MFENNRKLLAHLAAENEISCNTYSLLIKELDEAEEKLTPLQDDSYEDKSLSCDVCKLFLTDVCSLCINFSLFKNLHYKD